VSKAYVTIVVEPGKERSLKAAISEIPGVVTVDLTTGDHDMVCIIESESFKEILDTVVNRIRALPGVSNTRTSLVLE